jgi:hypothetical protein
MKSIIVFSLIACLVILSDFLPSALAVTDAELEALEKQIEQQELKDKKHLEEKQTQAIRKKEAEVQRVKKEQERQRQEEQRLLEDEKGRLEQEKRTLEAARLEQHQEQELKNKYTMIMSEAAQAFTNKDKRLAIKKYTEALALYPKDFDATLGLKNAETLKHKLCYQVLGKWIWDKTIGQEFIILHENGSIDYQTSAKGSGSWECTDPENRTIKIRISMAGFSNEWLSTYSADGRCLLGPETWGARGCYHRPE